MPVPEPEKGSNSKVTVGVLALQGDFREHAKMLLSCGADVVLVRRPEELASVDGLVIPGGESTTIDKLSRIFGLREPLREAIAQGLPVYGSCAGMILLADEIADPASNLAGEPQQTLGGLDITVRRNAFGRQIDSFETELDFAGIDPIADKDDAGRPGSAERPVHAVFIRAPWVERVGDTVQVLASVVLPRASESEDSASTDKIETEVRAVAVRNRHILATSFHPEVTGEHRIHELFIRMIRGEA